MELSAFIFLLLCILIIAAVVCFAVGKNSKSTSTVTKLARKYRASNDQSLPSSIANVSSQISSYLGFDPTGGQSPYNSAQFQQYLSDAVQALGQSSGSLIPQFAQYIGKLLNQVQQVSPLESGSFDQQQMGIIAGQLFLSALVIDMGNQIEWEGPTSDLIQDVGEAVQTYLDWLGDKKSSTDTGTYLTDPVIYNLNMDADGGYSSGTVQVLEQIIAAAKVDAWYLGSNNMNRARAWYDLGMFEGFKCIFTADGNTC